MSLMEQLSGVLVSQLGGGASHKTGLDQNMTATLMPLAVAALMGGLKKNTQSESGAAALSGALERHDGGLLDNLQRAQDDDVMADGSKILGHILGARQAPTERALAKTTGASQDQIGQLLAMAAPAVLGALGKQKREQGLGAGDLAALINQERQTMSNAAPRELGGLMQFFDADGDGDFQDDLIEQAGKSLLGNLFGKR